MIQYSWVSLEQLFNFRVHSQFEAVGSSRQQVDGV